MPIFARTKLVIHDDCLTPAMGSPKKGLSYATVSYSGPNPQTLYEQIKKLIVVVFGAQEREIQERNFSWDRSKPEETFRVTFEFVKDLDSFSFMWFTIILTGVARPSRQFGKEGNADMRIEAALRTEYPQDTLWQRSLLYEMFRAFYHRFIYEDKRQKFKNDCRDLVGQLQNEIKSFLNVLSKSG